MMCASSPDPEGGHVVSVILPLYNYGKFLSEAVKSVKAQTFEDWEIIVVDDASTDDSAAVAEKLAKDMGGRMRVIRNEKNRGVSCSRNTAVRAAGGEFIAFLDPDDAWAPTKLQKQIDLLASRRDVALVHTGVDILCDADTAQMLAHSGGSASSPAFWDEWFNGHMREHGGEGKAAYFSLLKEACPICLSSVMMRRDAFDRAEGFNEDLGYQVEDWLLWLKTSLLFACAFIEERLTSYRVHAQSYTCRVLNSDGRASNVAMGQVHDRCAAFARRVGASLRYRDFGRGTGRDNRLARIGRRLRWSMGNRMRGMMGRGGQGHDAPLIPPVPHAPDAQDLVARLSLLILFVTGNCNLRCKGCCYGKHLGKEHGLSLQHIRKIAESCGRPDTVLLTGGEPFLRNDLDRIINVFIETSHVSVNTNGLDREAVEQTVEAVLKQQDRHVLDVSVSIDGFEKTHNRRRGNSGAYAAALDSLRVLAALRREYKGLNITVQTTVCPENLDEIAELATEIADGFEPNWHGFEIERGSAESNTFFRENGSKLRSAIGEALSVIRRRYIHGYHVAAHRLEIECENLLQGRPWPFACVAGRGAAVVYPDGMLSACELRDPVTDLSAHGYDLKEAIGSDTMRGEVGRLASDKCFCTHGCWIQTSLYQHLSAQYGSDDTEFALKHQRLLAIACCIPWGRRIAPALGRAHDKISAILR